MADSNKKKSYVPKKERKIEEKPDERKTYEVILVKSGTLILSLNGNGYEIPIGKYGDKKVGDKIKIKIQ